MEPRFKTSFMPKKPVAPQTGRVPRGGSVGLFFLLTLIVFLAAVVVSAGLFLYQLYLTNSIERKSDELERARASFDPALIQELTRLDTRIETAGSLLDNHIALTRLFAFLEENTLESVQFQNFRYTTLSDEGVTIAMSGKAKSFGAVALQSDVFGNSSFIRDPIFSNLNVDVFGDVTFNMTAFVNPSMLSYRTFVSERGVRSPVEDTATTTGDVLDDAILDGEEIDTLLDNVEEELDDTSL